jgi:hypothetical protein
MGITLREASEKVGVTRQTLMKAIKTGRVSAEKSDNGEWRIEPVELFRVWPPVNEVQQPLQPELTGGDTPVYRLKTGCCGSRLQNCVKNGTLGENRRNGLP